MLGFAGPGNPAVQNKCPPSGELASYGSASNTPSPAVSTSGVARLCPWGVMTEPHLPHDLEAGVFVLGGQEDEVHWTPASLLPLGPPCLAPLQKEPSPADTLALVQ